MLLRREWLYRSHIEYWRAARGWGALAALSDKPAGRRPSRSQAEVDSERLRKENEKLALGLARTKAALEVVGKHTRSWKCSQRARIPAARIQGPDSAGGSAASARGLGQHLAQVDYGLGVDVFVAGRVEVFGLGSDGYGHLAVVPLLG